MKTTIYANGQLTIKAENDIEQYALKKWWTDYQQNTAILELQFDEEVQVVWDEKTDKQPGAATLKS